MICFEFLLPDVFFLASSDIDLESSDIEYIIDATKVVSKDVLKNLESLVVWGENLKGLCYGSIQPPWQWNLKTATIGCGEYFSFGNASQALFNHQVSLPALENLQMWDINCPRHIVGHDVPNGSLQKLESIKMYRVNGPTCVAKADSVKFLQNLNGLEVSHCEDFEVIFDLEGLKSIEGLVLFPRLHFLDLVALQKLESIWRMVPKGIQGFHNLRWLTVDHCQRLKYLLSPPLAKMLVGLEELDLSSCESLEEIIGGKEEVGELVEETGDDNIQEFVFPKLWRIHLYDLKKLRSFSPGVDHELIFPSLTDLYIINCPQMKKFSYGKLSAPLLERVRVRNNDDVVPIDLKDKVISSYLSILQY